MHYQLGKEITSLSNQIKRHMGMLAAKTGIGGSQGRILHYIIAHQNEDVFQRQIEEEFNLRPASASGILKLLEQNGYIIRVPMKSDARIKKIVLGKSIASRQELLIQDIFDFEDQLVEGMSQNEIQTLLSLLEKVSHNIVKK